MGRRRIVSHETLVGFTVRDNYSSHETHSMSIDTQSYNWITSARSHACADLLLSNDSKENEVIDVSVLGLRAV